VEATTLSRPGRHGVPGLLEKMYVLAFPPPSPPFGVVLFITTNGKENPRLDGWDWEVLLTTGGVTDSAKGSFIWRP